MQELEIAEYFEATKLMNPDLDFSSQYTFYYDETNNIRKFHIISEQEFNYSFHSNFVLGGFLFEKDKPNLDSLVSGLRLQPTVTEIKLKHLAKGDFTDCLKFPKLNYFLKFILDSPLYAHYSSINLLYYSIVDIVDSAISKSSVASHLSFDFANGLKDVLYKLCQLEIDKVINLFYKYQYPNIKKDKVLDFINDLTQLFSRYENEFEFHVGLTSLIQMLKEAKKQNSLPFITDEDDYILMKDFFAFYLRPLYTFKESNHIFDREELIINELKDMNLTDQGTPFVNHEFQDSKSELLIQASDIFVGLVGKLSAFLNSNSISNIARQLDTLSSSQLSSLDAFLKIINRSDHKNRAFFHNMNSLSELEKLRFIFESRGTM